MSIIIWLKPASVSYQRNMQVDMPNWDTPQQSYSVSSNISASCFQEIQSHLDNNGRKYKAQLWQNIVKLIFASWFIVYHNIYINASC
jgi:hypothetical protein